VAVIILAEIKSTSTVMQSEIVFQKNMKPPTERFSVLYQHCGVQPWPGDILPLLLAVFTELASNYE